MESVSRLTILNFIVLLLRSTNTFNIDNTPELIKLLNEPMVDFNKIVGGEDALIEEYPHQCGLVVNSSNFCGCYILSENWIGTAAHCVENINASGIDLRAGSTYRSRGKNIPIAEVISHPEYTPEGFDNDVAVLRTVKPLIFSEKMDATKLATPGNGLITGSEIRSSGWGLTSATSATIPEHLQDVEISVLSPYYCMTSYPFAFNPDTMFCAGNYVLGGVGSCEGDSGGAVVQNGTIVGSVAYGRACGQAMSPPVYIDFSRNNTARQFIRANTGL